MKRYLNHDDDFQIIQGKKVLKDNRVYRAKMLTMDAAPGGRDSRIANLIDARHGDRRRVTDGSGDELGLHRPGWRIFDVDDADDAKAEARRRYEQELCDSWRGDAASNPTKDPDLNDPDDDDDDDDDERPRRRRRFQKRDPFGRESGSISEEDGDRYQARLAMHRPGFRVSAPPTDHICSAGPKGP
jgi:hypothetical protein